MINRLLYRSYRFFYLWETWWRRRFTTAGILVLTTIVISAVLGIDTTRNMIYQIFSLSLSLLIISIVSSLFFKVDFEVKRIFPKFVTAGEFFRYRIEIKNKTESFQRDLSFFENPKDPRPDLSQLLSSKEPGEEKRNFWDRKILYYRWLWLVRKNQKAWFGENQVPAIPPGDTLSFEVDLLPRSRGFICLSGVIIARPDPFRLFRAFYRIDARQQLLVLPKRYRIPDLSLSGGRKYHSGGIALASVIGNSDEFVSLREFQPGDPFRNIHWKSWAKTGELIVREFQDEYFTRHALILDTYDEKIFSPLFEEAVSVASSFAASMKVEDAVLDLVFAGNRAYSFTCGRGLSTKEKILEILACIQTEQNNNIEQIMPDLEKWLPMLSGGIFIFIKWDSSRQKLFELLKSSGIAVLAVIITDDKRRCHDELDSYASEINILELGNIQEDLLDI